MPRPRLHLEMVEGWLWWAVYAEAFERSADVELSIKTARRAIKRLWK